MTDLQLSGFHPLMRDLIAVAVDLGWSPHQDARGARGKQNVTLHSYDGEQAVLCTPIRQINEAKLSTMRRKIIKYADPDQAAARRRQDRLGGQAWRGRGLSGRRGAAVHR